MEELDPKSGDLYRHRRGLTLRVLPGVPPGDREDSDRTYCEVVQQYDDPPTELDGYVDYEVGYRDGWWICRGHGWEKV